MEQDSLCDLCNCMKESSDHIWRCPALKSKAKQIDALLAEADPDEFTPAMRQGIACAMHCDPTNTFWGKGRSVDWDEARAKTYGCLADHQLGEETRSSVANIQSMEGTEQVTAREVMEKLTAK